MAGQSEVVAQLNALRNQLAATVAALEKVRAEEAALLVTEREVARPAGVLATAAAGLLSASSTVMQLDGVSATARAGVAAVLVKP